MLILSNTLDQYLDQYSTITKKLGVMIEAGDSDQIFSKRKAISALLPYAITRKKRGQPELLDMFLRAAQSTNFEDFIWVHPLANTLFSIPYPRSLDQVILLATPYAWRLRGPHSEDEVARWVSAVSAVPYTEKMGRCVVSALLQIAAVDPLRPHIPANLWGWLKKPQSPLNVPAWRRENTQFGVVHHIRGLGDIEILKSYLLIAWWNRDSPDNSGSTEMKDSLDNSGFAEMKDSIRKDFAGVGMSRHRRDLIKELEEVREKDFGSEREYGELKELLLQVDMEAKKTLTSALPKSSFFSSTNPL